MKRIALSIITLFICVVCYGATFNQYWYVGDNTPIQTSCTTGGDIILPTPPTKYGYDFIGWEQLPYFRIEYLESTGTQLIKADILDGHQYLHVKVGLSVSKFGHMGFIGSKGVSFYMSPSGYTFSFWMGYELSLVGGVSLDKKYDIDYIITPINIVFKIDDKVLNKSGYNLSTGKSVTLYSAGNTPTYAKFYYVQFFDENNILLADFIPVLDPAGIPCMYDKVEGKFYYNAGTGDFIAGPVVGGE